MEDKVKRYFADPQKIKAAEPLEHYILLITFDNGEKRTYNMEHELNGVFNILKNKEKFYNVFINEVGNVAWNIDDAIDSSNIGTIKLIFAKTCYTWKVYQCLCK